MTEETRKKEDPRILRMKELIPVLTAAAKAYYAEDEEIMSNLEYDRLYDELVALEKETGITMAGSPTVSVGYDAVDELPKERHERPMLSLDKTKSREALGVFLGSQEGLLSWKLDGLTVVLTYGDGILQKAVTRGNGEVGEVITPNARTFENLPMRIPFTGRLILRGEAVIRYSDFEKINERLMEEAAGSGDAADVRYKNPRNLCSGSVRQLDSAVTARRHVRFYAFSLVEAQGVDFADSHENEFRFLREQGFDVVEYRRVNAKTAADTVGWFEERVAREDLPSDGLVLLMDGIAYGASLGMTAKFPRNAIAFKWADELQETTLREMEWSVSRTGLINPVAIFDPVELEGTTVRRASVHNVSIVRSLRLGIGDRITVYKANMIIPQIAEDLTGSGTLEIPDRCPVCGAPTEIRSENGSESLFCTDPACPAKMLGSFVLFAGRSGMNIDGLSEMTLEKLIAKGFIHRFGDIFRLGAHRQEIEQMEGLGAKSADNLLRTIDSARKTTLPQVLSAIGIPGIGPAGARSLSRHFDGDLSALRAAPAEELSAIDGVGPVMASQVTAFFADPDKGAMLDDLAGELEIVQEEGRPQDSPVSGKTFVVTGAVHIFANRDDLKAFIDRLGGKVAGSVSSRTDYLINNDASSGSSKNRKAAELGIPILTEEAFLAMADPDGVLRGAPL